MLELKLKPQPKPEPGKNTAGGNNKQRGQLRFALALLLVALVALLVRDREFWFGPENTLESNSAAPSSTLQTQPVAAPPTITQPPAAQSETATNPTVAKAGTQRAAAQHKSVSKQSSQLLAQKRPNSTEKTVQLPSTASGPEVAKVHAAAASEPRAKVTTSVESLPTNAAEHEPLSRVSIPVMKQTVDSTYPLLGPRMNVQGSVVLQAVIGADGSIENLRVLSGPAVLTAAAQQAVRQWRFKPYMENGQAVETKATITVNFSIRVSDNPSKAS